MLIRKLSNLIFKKCCHINKNQFWSKKNTEKPEPDQHDEKNWSNLGSLIQDMRDKNKQKKFLLPPKEIKDSDKLTVAIEMDEVLLYVFAPDEHEAYLSQPLMDYDYCVYYQDFDIYLNIYKRPYLKEFLEYLRLNTEPILYTKGVKSYVDLVLKLVDPENTFKHVITQEEGCTRVVDTKEHIDDYFKDINQLNRDLSRTVYIDTKAIAFWPQPENSVPIQEYIADSTVKDVELLTLMEFLEELKRQDVKTDVRTICNERFQIKQALVETNML